MTEITCQTCIDENTNSHKGPCIGCFSHDQWRAKSGNVKGKHFKVGDRVNRSDWIGGPGTVVGDFSPSSCRVEWDSDPGAYYVCFNDSLKLIENLGTESPKTTESAFAVNSDAMEPDTFKKFGLVDSGQRTKMGTGAVRETAGKGRCDMLPWDVLPRIIHREDVTPMFCLYMDAATKRHDEYSIEMALAAFAENAFNNDPITAILAASHQFEAGAAKYKDGRNWEKGIALNCYLSSAGRHYLKWLRGDTDEPHDRAVVWNLLCALWTIKHKPEMIDAEVPDA